MEIFVTENGVMPDPEKVSALTSYFRRFIPYLSDIIKPLQILTHKNSKFNWGEEEKKSFEVIKILTSPPLLKLPDEEHDFVLFTDASSYSIGAVLEQYDENKQLRPVAYHSRRLQKSERNYANY
ncbi:Retrovirus-related Pol polyprotein from transposon [Smittium culicis]|uniref:Retrovirus-related Pol polyprotein from transposon n=1 Tax=Smittium culicis TaxID=133412 RepID=A0A1R1XUR0_9FUNG|nr:Retrovirus-related Pol polyprotein from transposon [Smittium culicis]